ncbi:MAG: tyrosine-type recombinase/integrase, partial [Clostridia bacterium]|nr:tyrosine-type recombinase/integrase [Clostridia bacterium]
ERQRELRRHKDRERKNAAYYRARGKSYTPRPAPEGAANAPDLVTPHYFRHNFATVLYDAGVDVLSASKVMGHADTKTTLSIYTDIANSRRVASGAASIKLAFSSKVAEKLPNDTASGENE